MAAKVKICGVTTPAALDAAITARAEYVGLNFFPPSPRHLPVRDAGALAARTEGRIISVGVFVDPDDSLLTQAVTAARLGAIQLHGAESPARAAEVKARFGMPVWKVLPVSSASDIARAESYVGAADFILFDAKTPKGSAIPGGMGLRFDWQLLAAYHGGLPWGLAGGLTASNVAEAIRATGAPLVDTSSGVESAPGVKDVDRIAAFCKAARL
ncbi:phosphoribosylanthranilate isomerase [Allopontixanthobacter sediminis]|uniref:N-(5'-phosphoribosyl)anthranilate isomerase n=1 Tax=Allopontixanthobacter sediminis TaxID=1689985 RepID=A0A845AZR5_9SPHN|nr:phosphoribosylanthranilate isomerase [Allopontixanthobacter sediminis]MXP43374.1 phosphoribosylanthranilate isomerase [Allopontixanthobacter sediminis]